MLLLVIISSVVAFSFAQIPRTFGDVRQCVTGNYTYCQTYCQKWHPNFRDFNKVQTCFEQRTKDYQECMKRNGVFLEDSSPCFQQSESDRGNHRNDIDDLLPNAVRCYKRCLKRVRRRCRKSCTASSPNDRESKLKECKNDDSVLDCLESENSGSTGFDITPITLGP